WVDCKADVDYVGEGRKIRVWRTSQYEYTETKKYEIIRRGQIDINNVEEIAFSKIEKRLLNGIGPYNIEETIPFSMAYLSGFFAEQYNISKEEAAPMVKEQVNRYSKYLIDETVGGFNYVSKLRNNVDISLKQWNYTLLPAWILTYSYN